MPDTPALMCRIQFRSDPFAVRDALAGARNAWQVCGCSAELCDKAEQVLAEVLNNVVEHAYGDTPGGAVEVILDHAEDGLRCEVRDNGAPMPGERLPAGQLAALGDRLEDLPEGGFGWYMIRTMTEDLTYRRMADWNVLSFRIAVPRPQHT